MNAKLSGATQIRCADCRYFDNTPRALEAAVPGLRVMGSAYSSVRSGDGLCSRHERYLSGEHRCALFESTPLT